MGAGKAWKFSKSPYCAWEQEDRGGVEEEWWRKFGIKYLILINRAFIGYLINNWERRARLLLKDGHVCEDEETAGWVEERHVFGLGGKKTMYLRE